VTVRAELDDQIVMPHKKFDKLKLKQILKKDQDQCDTDPDFVEYQQWMKKWCDIDQASGTDSLIFENTILTYLNSTKSDRDSYFDAHTSLPFMHKLFGETNIQNLINSVRSQIFMIKSLMDIKDRRTLYKSLLEYTQLDTESLLFQQNSFKGRLDILLIEQLAIQQKLNWSKAFNILIEQNRLDITEKEISDSTSSTYYAFDNESKYSANKANNKLLMSGPEPTQGVTFTKMDSFVRKYPDMDQTPTSKQFLLAAGIVAQNTREFLGAPESNVESRKPTPSTPAPRLMSVVRVTLDVNKFIDKLKVAKQARAARYGED
jgi:hypothetical protein